MKTKIVYVLVSNEEDYYTEQFFISSYSVKYHTPQAIIVLLTDSRTNKYLSAKCSGALQFVDSVVSIDFPDGYDNKRRSRYLKTGVRNYIEGDYLFIDTDTVVCSDLSSIDKLDSQIAAVYDMHTPLKKHLSYNEIVFKSKLIDYELKDTDQYFNSGIMFVKDTGLTREFYKKWHQNYIYAIERGVTTDQQALLKTNSEFDIIDLLDDTWNCQIINNISCLESAKIIHYYCSGVHKKNETPPYKLMSKSVCKQIREEGFSAGEWLKNDICNAKNLFASPVVLLSGEDIRIKESLQYYLLSQLYYNHNNLFRLIENAVATFRNIKRKFQ